MDSNESIWILHITDLHVGSNDYTPTWKDRLDPLVIKWRSTTKRRIPDLCFITGDITGGAQPNQFTDATRVISSLSESLWPGRQFADVKNRIFVVPGNHDQDRTVLLPQPSRRILAPSGYFRHWLSFFRDFGSYLDKINNDVSLTFHPSSDGVSMYLYLTDKQGNKISGSNGFVALPKDHPCFSNSIQEFNSVWFDAAKWSSLVSPRFSAYHKWHQQVFDHVRPHKNRSGGGWNYPFRRGGRTIHIVGLNSAVASHGWLPESDHGNVFLSSQQVNEALHDINENDQENDLVVSLMHHPWDSLHCLDCRERSSGILIRRRSSFVVTGHIHRQWLLLTDTYSGFAPVISGRALGNTGGDEESHGFNIIEVRPDDSSVYLYPFRRSSNSDYIEDVGTGTAPFPIKIPLNARLRSEGPLVDLEAPHLSKAIPGQSRRPLWRGNLNEPHDVSAEAIGDQIFDLVEKESIVSLTSKILVLLNRYKNDFISWGYKDAHDELLALARRGAIPKPYLLRFANELNPTRGVKS